MDIAFVAGEASADRYGAALLNAMRKEREGRKEPINAWGVGGVLMQEAGFRLLCDSRSWGVIGVAESLARLPSLLVALQRMKRALRRRPPDALILIDFGAFNVPLGKWAKSQRICPVVYYIPPGAWRRRTSAKRLANLAGAADFMLTPFGWSEANLRSAGIDAYFLGHPLLDLVQPKLPAEQFDRQFGLDPQRAVVALLPGSRRQELQHILPALFGAAGEIAQRVPGSQFLLALAPNVPRAAVEEILHKEQELGGAASLLRLMQQAGGRIRRAARSALRSPLAPAPRLATSEGVLLAPEAASSAQSDTAEDHSPKPPHGAPLAVVEGLTYDAMARADLVIAASGTATLEAAILHKPMIIVYRGSRLMRAEWRVRRRALALKYIGLPNILADHMVCPELVSEEATAKAIADHGVEMLLQPERLLQMKEHLIALVADNLGEPGAIRRAARLILDRLEPAGGS